MAEAFDFGITVSPIDAAAMKPAMEAAEAAYQASQVYEDPVYTGFEDWMKQNAPWWAENCNYTFYDINHDGEEELLISMPEGAYDAGAIDRYLTLENGQVEEYHLTKFLCEGNVYEVSYPWADHSTQYVWNFYHYADEIWEEGSALGKVIRYSNGTWRLSTDGSHEAKEVTQTEAEAFLSQFKRVALDWKPIREYPLADGSTVADYLDSLNVPVSNEELHQMYANFWAEQGDDWYTHYRIMDVNSDGVDDLILSHDGEKCWETYTYRYGQIDRAFYADVYYCQGNIWEHVDIYHPEIGTEIEQHEFYQHTGEETVSVAYAAYNKATASWQSDLDGTPMSDGDAKALIEKYSRVDLQLRPIEELIGG